HSLRQQLGAQHLINPQRLALIGYSMGGYGVLTAAGARFDANSPLMSMVPGGLLVPYAGAQREAVVLSDVQAVVAIAPLGGGPRAAWGAQGLQGIHVHCCSSRAIATTRWTTKAAPTPSSRRRRTPSASC
ncbi:MAG: hypothetical protein JOY91_11275, partial [Sinobacteraceae bacterium]|nr:hypothetical protein [Nevskiaceae bacterium]